MRVTWRLTLSGTEFGLDHVGIGKWIDEEPVSLGGWPVGPFDDKWTAVAVMLDEHVAEQLSLW